jgi:hypothetical protein
LPCSAAGAGTRDRVCFGTRSDDAVGSERTIKVVQFLQATPFPEFAENSHGALLFGTESEHRAGSEAAERKSRVGFGYPNGGTEGVDKRCVVAPTTTVAEDRHECIEKDACGVYDRVDVIHEILLPRRRVTEPALLDSYRSVICAQLGSLSFPERSQAHTQNLYGPRAARRDGAVHASERSAAESTVSRSLDELKIAFVLR